MNLGKISAGASLAALLLGGIFWIFQVNATANEALRVAQEAKAIANSKADTDDIQRLDGDIRDLRKSLEDAELIEKRK